MSNESDGPRLRSATPVLVVADVVRSAEHYRDRLGFRFNRYWGDPPCFVIVYRDGAEVFFKQIQSGMKPQSNFPAGDVWDAYFTVNDVDALHAEFLRRGAKVVCAPEDTVYQMRELVVEDPDGYRLCFAQDTSGAAQSS